MLIFLIEYQCPSFDSRPFRNICQGEKSLRTSWHLGQITEWADKCLEKCKNQAKQSGYHQGCCEGRTSGFCQFYSRGYIKHSVKHRDTKAVLCQRTGKMTNSCLSNE